MFGLQSDNHTESSPGSVRDNNPASVRNPENTGNLGPSDASPSGTQVRVQDTSRDSSTRTPDTSGTASGTAQNPFDAVKNMSDMDVTALVHLASTSEESS